MFLNVNFNKSLTGLFKKVKSENERSNLAKKNILISFFLRGIEIVIDFALVPLSLAYLTETNYGVWLTIFSIVNWLKYLDFGLTHGLRNRLSIALSQNNITLAKELVSTTYVVIFVFCLLLLFISYFAIPLFNWNSLLNAYKIDSNQLTYIILIVIECFILKLAFNTITSVFLAKQMPWLRDLTQAFTKSFILLGVIFLISKSDSINNLKDYALVFSVLPILVLFTFTILFFLTKYRDIKPSILWFNYYRIYEVVGLGSIFFIIQLSMVMLFLTDNLIISHIIDPKYVTSYQITHKYFSIIQVIFIIIITPFWSAATHAYNKGDIIWIRRSVKKLHKIWFIMLLIVIVMIALFDPITKVWIGKDFEVPFLLVILWAGFVVLYSLNSIYTFFLNGIGKLRIQLITGLITIVLNVPLSIFLAQNLNLGSSGVILATNISILFYVVLRRIQFIKIVNNKANGIWNK